MPEAKKLKYFVNGEWHESKTDRYMDVYDPSTGEVIAKAPQCTSEEVLRAVEAAEKAFPEWSNTPVMKRVQVLYKLRELMLEHLDELTELVCRETAKYGEKPKGRFKRLSNILNTLAVCLPF